MDSSGFRGRFTAIMMMAIMLFTPLQTVFPPQVVHSTLDELEASPSIHMDVDFNESDGFTQSNISVEQATGEVLLDRPLILVG